MRISHNWLQKFFTEPLPKPEEVAKLLTFHSSEIDEVIDVGSDVIYDVAILPDKAPWLLSHRGVAKELSTSMGIPLSLDPLLHHVDLTPQLVSMKVSRDTTLCDRYAGVRIQGVSVGPSPTWLKDSLEAIGQRSINNIVDATNYVMFHMGQPLHAFDVSKFKKDGETYKVVVRMATEGEEITTLTNDSYTLTKDDMLIVDGVSDTPLGIAGIKGGKVAEVDQETTDIFVEAAHFNQVSVRKSSQRLKLRTDASQRFENGIVSALVPIALKEVEKLILDVAGGESFGFVDDADNQQPLSPVSVSLMKLQSMLGVTLTVQEVCNIFDRFQYSYHVEDQIFTVTPPIERTDLQLAEDLVEEVGRMYGLEHIQSVVPSPVALSEINSRHYYSEKIRSALSALGYSEIYTSTFRNEGTVRIQNALASDKGWLRDALNKNLKEALIKNVANKDLLGLSQIALYEIGTIFKEEDERYHIALGVQSGAEYKPKLDNALLEEGKRAVEVALGEVALSWDESVPGICEVDLSPAILRMATPTAYVIPSPRLKQSYIPYSQYPFIARDIALWVDDTVTPLEVEEILNEKSGELRVRTTLFDEYKKDGRTSYAFRLVFQSSVRTLTDSEINTIMEEIYTALKEKGWEVR